MSAPKQTPLDLSHFIAEAITEAGGIDFDLHEPPTVNFLGTEAIDEIVRPLLAVTECVDALRWRTEERAEDRYRRVWEVLERHGWSSDGEPFSETALQEWVENLAARALSKARGA